MPSYLQFQGVVPLSLPKTPFFKTFFFDMSISLSLFLLLWLFLLIFFVFVFVLFYFFFLFFFFFFFFFFFLFFSPLFFLHRLSFLSSLPIPFETFFWSGPIFLSSFGLFFMMFLVLYVFCFLLALLLPVVVQAKSVLCCC